MNSRLWAVVAAAGVLLLIGSVAAIRAVGAQSEAPAPAVRPAVVRTITLRVEPFTMQEIFHGLIEPYVQVDLAFPTLGRVTQLGPNKDGRLRENDRVQAGQIVAMLDAARPAALAERVEAEMEQSKAAMAAAEAKVADAQARLDDAKRAMERVERLLATQAAGERDVEEARLKLQAAQAAFDGVSAELAAATATYNAGRAALSVANVDLQEATLRSPIDGIVARVPTEVGQMMQPGQPVVTIVDTSKVKLVLRVVEHKVPLLKKGQKVGVQVRSLAAAGARGAAAVEEVREGTITLVPPAADPVTRMFHVEIELINPDGRLRPGMIGRAIVTVLEGRAIAIPAEAVTRSGDTRSAFFVVEDHAAAQFEPSAAGALVPVARQVVLQPTAFDNDRYLVAELPAGLDRLVIDGQSRLSDGQPVLVVE